MSELSIQAAVAPKVSVVIPVRNDAARLRQCLSSLRASDNGSFEIIVVDDASTDQTPDVAATEGAGVLRLSRRGGPAVARNRGVSAASAPIIFFLDADVCVHRDAVSRVIRLFEQHPQVDAAFGSYDLNPGSPNLISQYKNLFHRFVHQRSMEEAGTFWTGCGAIRKSVFQEFGGFDASYERPCIEDIELGARLKRSGRRIRIDKELQATHLKTWTAMGLLKSDIFDRGIPWTRLMLRERDLPRDLNLSQSQRICAALACLLALLFLGGAFRHSLLAALPVTSLAIVLIADRLSGVRGMGRGTRQTLLCVAATLLAATSAELMARTGWWGASVAGLVLAIVLLNVPFYRFFLRHRGWGFTLLTVPLHLSYYVYSSGALAVGIFLHLQSAARGRKAEMKYA